MTCAIALRGCFPTFRSEVTLTALPTGSVRKDIFLEVRNEIALRPDLSVSVFRLGKTVASHV